MSSTTKNKILITGGAGFVGSKVAALLLKKGFEVSVVDFIRDKEFQTKFSPLLNFYNGDLRDRNFTESVLQNIDIVVHLAADIGPLNYMHDKQADILLNNSAIDISLYPSMVKNGVSTVIYSSSSMVFQNSPKFPYKESDLAKVNLPDNIYGFSKLSGEYFCKAFQKQYNLNYVIMRYHNIYGPGEEYKGQGYGNIHVIPALVEKVLSGQYPLEIIGEPESTRPFTYIDDAVDATVRIVEEVAKGNKKVINNDFNIGPNQAAKIIEVAKLIWELAGDGRKFSYKVIKNKSTTAHRREMSARKAKSILKWETKISLEEGIKLLLKDYQNKKYI